MSARGIIGGLAGVAKSAVIHPRTTTEQAIGIAKEMATTGTMVAERLARRGVHVVKPGGEAPAAQPHTAQEIKGAAAQVTHAAEEAVAKPVAEATAAIKKPAAKKPAAKKPAAKKPAAKRPAAKKPAAKEPEVVLAVDLATPPQEPPVDVVGQALAKEAEEKAARAPRGSTLPPVRDQDEAAADPATLKAVRAEAEMMTKAASHKKS